MGVGFFRHPPAAPDALLNGLTQVLGWLTNAMTQST